MCLDQTHTRRKRGEVFGFMFDACRETTLIILMVAAAASLALGIKTELTRVNFKFHEDDANILDRKNVFGSNTYSRKKGRSFWRFLLDACRETTLIILMVAAAASLALGIKTEGIKEGWYDGGSIALAVIIVIVVTVLH
ncbi:putative P-type Ca(2+) transporter [Helianthus annuus]|nr:putative P-type Ca(2+) transporter [Helianthus annuus]